MKKFVLFAIAVIFTWFLSGCDTAYTANNYMAKLSKANTQLSEAQAKLVDTNSKLLTQLFNIAQTSGNIYAFENFLAQSSPDDKRRAVAFKEIWSLTRKLDIWEGYIDFVNNHKDAPAEVMQEALNRVFEIAYASAEKENTLESYQEVLNKFPNAPEELQIKAVDNAVKIIQKDFPRIISEAMARFEMSSATPIEKANFIATHLYAAGVDAEDKKDRAKLMIISAVFEKSPIIKNTTTYADFKSARKLEQILREIKVLRTDIRVLRNDLMGKINQILSKQEVQFNVLMTTIKNQEKLISKIADDIKDFSWDKSLNNWQNIKNIGIAAIPYVAKVGVTLLLADVVL